ncbi:MAG: molybdopterin biosynthesis protein [Anaerolineaceae bacterium]|nr:molybdopterin biosynthesis protein [Anaerolineaceae bacterium]
MTQHERNVYLVDIPLDEARARLTEVLQAAGRWVLLPGETVSVTEALGRVTAAPVWAKLSSPHYHTAAMDGYAVWAADTVNATETRPLKLRVVPKPASGTGEKGDQGGVAGLAYAVNTGDPLPPDTNAVIMIEHVQQVGEEFVEIRAAVASWQHVRPLGEDMVATELVLPVNHRIRPVDLGALAGSGNSTVLVRRAPRVAIIPTGSELIPAGRTPQPGQIIEYNSLVLAAQVQEAGGATTVSDIVPDDVDQLRAAIQTALGQSPDLLLVLSGSSAGSRDHTASLVGELGELLVHGIAVRPGHPVIIGMIEGIPVIGVPGYPVSAALTGELFVEPLLAHWGGKPSALESRTRVQAVTTRKIQSPIGDDDFVRVTVAPVGERLLATPLNRGAGVITSLVRADGLAQIPRFSEGIDSGQAVDVILYRTLDEIQHTLLLMGSHDPMLDFLGQYLTEHSPGWRLVSGHVGSLGGLVALRRKEAHAAGIHLLNPQTGAYNIDDVRKYLPDEPLILMTFAHREQGLIVAPGNPLAIQSLDDLPRVRYINRQRGAGTRVLLDYELAKRNIAPTNVSGYDREEFTHLAVAAAVASGAADCGLGVRSAAIAMNLDFISVGWERYDLVLPTAYHDDPGVKALRELLTGDEFPQALGAHPGYDTRETGQIQYTQ